jgi:hypothetical protein
MNVIDAWVTKVLCEPYCHSYGSHSPRWWVKVEAQDMGGTTNDTLMFDTLEEAEKVQPGYKFQH